MTKLSLTRRKFLQGLAAATVVGAGLGVGVAYPFDYELTETEVFIPGLPAAFEGFRVAQLSDVHHSSLVPLAEVRRAVALTQSTNADAIMLTGDYTTKERRFIEPCAEELSRLTAPAGVWAVLGNHDHNTNGLATRRALERRGVNVMTNVNTRLARGGEELQLVGVDDWSWNQTDWEQAFKGVDRQRPSLLLSHQPRVLDLPQTEGVSLILSGHTHGGQVRLPVVGSPAALMGEDFKYLRGRFVRDGRQLYVTRGTGVIGLPVRIGARPEVAVLRLRRTQP
ncbi:MAG TPA: metallophosphoesterase [Pyrinomonadaceae bacterium]|nr:metallophosphoesterase [Pyrinomonadaceae bacterium]